MLVKCEVLIGLSFPPPPLSSWILFDLEIASTGFKVACQCWEGGDQESSSCWRKKESDGARIRQELCFHSSFSQDKSPASFPLKSWPRTFAICRLFHYTYELCLCLVKNGCCIFPLWLPVKNDLLTWTSHTTPYVKSVNVSRRKKKSVSMTFTMYLCFKMSEKLPHCSVKAWYLRTFSILQYLEFTQF